MDKADLKFHISKRRHSRRSPRRKRQGPNMTFCESSGHFIKVGEKVIGSNYRYFFEGRLKNEKCRILRDKDLQVQRWADRREFQISDFKINAALNVVDRRGLKMNI
jgi:hypothetical protein